MTKNLSITAQEVLLTTAPRLFSFITILKFVEKLLKAKQVRISTNIYQQGSPVFEFDVSGFNQEKYKPKK
jgi:hypothetical protein